MTGPRGPLLPTATGSICHNPLTVVPGYAPLANLPLPAQLTHLPEDVGCRTHYLGLARRECCGTAVRETASVAGKRVL